MRALDPEALAAIAGGAGGTGSPPVSPQTQAMYNNALTFLEHNGGGGPWQLGAAHHQGITMSSYAQAGDPTPYKAIFANNGDHTAQVLVNATTGAAVRRLF